MPKETGHHNETPFNFIYISTPEEIEARKLMEQGHDIFADPNISEDTKLRIIEHEKFIEIQHDSKDNNFKDTKYANVEKMDGRTNVEREDL